jgi:hypothetical protein
VKIKGVSGRLMAGGRLAAQLGNWEGDYGSGGGSITAIVKAKDAFWLENSTSFTLLLGFGSSEKKFSNATVVPNSSKELMIRFPT